MIAFDAPALDAPFVLPAGFVAAQNVLTLRIASHGFLSSGSDTPADTLYEARLLGDLEIAQSASDALTVGGRVALTASELDLWNGDGVLTPVIAEGRADGRTIDIRAAPVGARHRSDWGATYASAPVVWRGRVVRIEDQGDRARLQMSDTTERLNTPLQIDKYDGTGGMSGTTDLKGRPKPVSLGWRFNVTPVYVGQVDLGAGALPTYQTHNGPIIGHDAVRIRGVVQSLVSGTPEIGQYAEYPTLGAFQLGSTADGAVTCDVNGDIACGLTPTVTAVISRLLTGYGASLSASDFDPTSWFAAGPMLPGAIGWGTGADEVNTLDALNEILSSCAAFLCGSRDGRLRLVALGPPVSQPQFLLAAHNCVSVTIESPSASIQPAPQRVDIGAARNWTVLSEIAGSVSGAERTALTNPGAVESVLSEAIAAKSVRARTWAIPGLYRHAADARARGEALRAWLERGLRVVKIVTDRYLGAMELGLTGRVTYPLYGLQNGWDGVVVGYRERIGQRRLEIMMIG